MASSAQKFNLRNPAVKRIMQEIKEMQAETSADFIADALEDDIFEWHFVVRGPPDTEFEGGIYHGRILLPAEYPFKPPSFMMLTPNGRFQTGVKICLSISSHHPEHWQPSWSVRTALTALIAFMPTPGQGALGSVDFTKEERQQLAAKSRSELPKFGSPARQKVIQEMHQRMLDLQASAAAISSSSKVNESAAVVASADVATAAGVGDQDAGSKQQHTPKQDQQRQEPVKQQQKQQQQQHGAEHDRSDSCPVLDNSRNSSSSGDTVVKPRPQTAPPALAAANTAAAAAPAATPAAVVVTPAVAAAAATRQQLQLARAAAAVGSRPGELPGDRGLTFLIVVLSVAIVAILFKKVITAAGGYGLMV